MFYRHRSFCHPNQKLDINLGTTDLRKSIQAFGHHSQCLQKDPGNNIIYKNAYLSKYRESQVCLTSNSKKENLYKP